jgi:ketosteroid isomerase-like protein
MTGSILDTIDRFWKVRIAGDAAGVLSFMTPDATYELVGGKSFAEPAMVGPAPAGPAVGQLVAAFKFHKVDQLTAVVEGRRAAVVNRLEVSFRGGPPVVTQACDLWEFDEAGKATSLRQFVDTDLVRRMIAGAV